MKLPALAVLKTPVIIQPVGNGAVLLGLQDQRIGFDGMYRAGINLNKIPLADRNLPDQLLPFSPMHHFLQFLSASGIVADHQGGILLTVHNIPALGLTQASVLMLLCIGIVRMHLDAQIVLGINDLGQ